MLACLEKAMSKLETPMTRWYWQQVGGTLIEEFIAVAGTATCGGRILDGVILLDDDRRIAPQSESSRLAHCMAGFPTQNSGLAL